MRKQEMLVVKHITRCAFSQGPTPCRTLTATPTRKLFISSALKNDLPTANNSSLPSTTRTSSSARISGSTFATCFAKTFPPFPDKRLHPRHDDYSNPRRLEDSHQPPATFHLQRVQSVSRLQRGKQHVILIDVSNSAGAQRPSYPDRFGEDLLGTMSELIRRDHSDPPKLMRLGLDCIHRQRIYPPEEQ